MPAGPFKIIVAEPYPSSAIEQLRPLGEVVELADCRLDSVLAAVVDGDALLVKSSCQVTRQVIEAASRLQVIGRGGTGLDNIDLNAAAERGMKVVYTPQAATEAVADLTFALMLGLTWKLRNCDRAVREGDFLAARSSLLARELGGSRLGIIGMGRIGRAVGRRAVHGFLMEVSYHDIVDVGDCLDFPAAAIDLDSLLQNVDILSLHVPLTDRTRGMISDKEMEKLRPGTILINTSRGAVVDANALSLALIAGRVGGAGLDVFDPEPLPVSSPLLRAPNTLFTPHVGARTAMAQNRMNAVVGDVIRVLRDQAPIHPAFP